VSTKPPECRNPQHPFGQPRSMSFLEQKGQAFVFACIACKERLKVLSVQVVTSAALKKDIRRKLMREGKILTKPAYVDPRRTK
jgi:hypothetical protein